MNTHRYTVTLSVITILICIPNLFSQTEPTDAKAVSASNFANLTVKPNEFAINEAYRVENTGMNARAFAQTRTTASRLRVMEGQRKAEQVATNANMLIANGKEKIRSANERLAHGKRTGGLSAQAIRKLEVDILLAMEKLELLKQSVLHLSKIGPEKTL